MGKTDMGVIKMLSMQIQDDVDKGPVQQIRDQYALRGAVEKEVMKLKPAKRPVQKIWGHAV